MDIALSTEMLGRVFDGAGRPIDGLGESLPRRAAQHQRLSPSTRCPVSIPSNCIYTGISAIDGTDHPDPGPEAAHLLRLRHAATTSWPPRSSARPRSRDEDGEFAIVFAAMGVKNDVAEFFPPQL